MKIINSILLLILGLFIVSCSTAPRWYNENLNVQILKSKMMGNNGEYFAKGFAKCNTKNCYRGNLMYSAKINAEKKLTIKLKKIIRKLMISALKIHNHSHFKTKHFKKHYNDMFKEFFEIGLKEYYKIEKEDFIDNKAYIIISISHESISKHIMKRFKELNPNKNLF